ncbi:MAG TPA: ATP-dependent helicase, partial [Gemmataceae bacterium]|nr:ATP-dependent helicase [Gemmataceae bacterium]
MEATPILLTFDGGTLLISGAPVEKLTSLPYCQLDPRNNVVRAEGRHYRTIVEHLRQNKVPYTDQARNWEQTPWLLR